MHRVGGVHILLDRDIVVVLAAVDCCWRRTRRTVLLWCWTSWDRSSEQLRTTLTASGRRIQVTCAGFNSGRNLLGCQAPRPNFAENLPD